MIDLLAGTGSTEALSDARQQLAEDMIRVFEAQRLVSLTTLFDLADNLESVTKGEKLNTALAGKLAARISDIQLPRSAFTSAERNSLSFGYYTEKHIEQQRKLNLRLAIESAASDPNKLREIRGTLAPFLRDTLVGYNYIHYAPPGRAGAAHQPPVRPQPRFHRHSRRRPDLESDRAVRHRLARQRRRTPRRLARFPALRVGRSRAKFPDPVSRTSSHLGRPGPANDPQRRNSPVVGRDSPPAPLGRHQHGVRRNTFSRERAKPRPPQPSDGNSRTLRPARPRQENGAPPGGGRRQSRRRKHRALGDVFAGHRNVGSRSRLAHRRQYPSLERPRPRSKSARKPSPASSEPRSRR